MLVSMKEILDRASKENYGVIAPNVRQMFGVLWMQEHALQLRKKKILH